MIYLFDRRGLSALADFVDPETLFAFDLDGTLVPIAAEPSGIRLSPAVREALVELKQRATLAIITGRSRKDAQRHLGIMPHYLVGNHGSEGLPGWEGYDEEFRRRSDQWTRQLHSLIPEGQMSGVFAENKGLSVSVHFRNAPDRTAARSAVLGAIDRLTPPPRIVGGKYVENLLPEEAPNKGTALLQLMNQADCAKGLFVGDDRTDEDVFQLNWDHLFTIRVGNGKNSRAGYFLRKQEEILILLQHINVALAKGHPSPP
jgi:trehalose 6-phosphate phosphatase